MVAGTVAASDLDGDAVRVLLAARLAHALVAAANAAAVIRAAVHLARPHARLVRRRAVERRPVHVEWRRRRRRRRDGRRRRRRAPSRRRRGRARARAAAADADAADRRARGRRRLRPRRRRRTCGAKPAPTAAAAAPAKPAGPPRFRHQGEERREDARGRGDGLGGGRAASKDAIVTVLEEAVNSNGDERRVRILRTIGRIEPSSAVTSSPAALCAAREAVARRTIATKSAPAGTRR